MIQALGHCGPPNGRERQRRERVWYRHVLFGGLIVLLGLVFGKPALAEAAEAPEQIVVGVPNDIVSLDPEAQAEFGTRMIMEGSIEENLVRLSADGEYHPLLATAWRIVDPTTWEFSIREGVRFHDGEPLTAETVKFSIDRCLNPATKCPRRGQLAEIKEAVVVNGSTIRIITQRPSAALPTALTYLPIVPMKAIQADPQLYGKRDVGTGPMRFVEWVKGQRLVTERYDGYWDKKSAFKRIVYRPIPEGVTRIAALQSHEVDMISNLDPEMASVIERTPGLRVDRRGMRMIFIGLDATGNNNKALADKRVRQAMNYAVNKEVLIKDILGGYAFPNVGAMFPINPGFDRALKPYPYDPQQAKRLLAAAGYQNGFDVTFTFAPGIEGSLKTAEIVQSIASDLGSVGIRAHIEQVEPAASWERYYAKRLQMFVGTWGSSPEAGLQFRTLLHSKARGLYYVNPQADQLIDAYFSAMDARSRGEAGTKLHRFVNEDVPFIFLYHQHQLFGLRSNITWAPRPVEFIYVTDLGWKP
jgi:peptide/nickel transport system substrate-binding protein